MRSILFFRQANRFFQRDGFFCRCRATCRGLVSGSTRLDNYNSTNAKQPSNTALCRGASHLGSLHGSKSSFGVTQQSRCSLSTLSKRQQAHLEDRLVSVVGKRTQDPVLETDLHHLGWIHPRMAVSDDGTCLQVLLRLPTLLHPSLDDLKQLVHDQVVLFLQEHAKEHPDVADALPSTVHARLLEHPDDFLKSQGPGLADIAHFLAVYSCKGGVGKSTVAVNLAYELARLGGRVGLIDLDVYGPSLPVLIQPDDVAIRRSDKGKGMIVPIEHAGVKVLSLGFVNRASGVPGSGTDNGAAIMRGPMAGKVVEQLLKGTDWGPLDVLVLDLPPGTGDVQLQVCQDLSLSGAVAVTTPSKLAVVDTRKGIEMFTSLGVPTLSVVQNMSYFESEDGKRHFPLGKGVLGEERLGGVPTEKIIEMPMSLYTSDSNDSGKPLSLERPAEASRELAAYEQLARDVSGGLLKTFYGTTESNEVVKFHDSTEEFTVSSVDLSLDSTTKEFIVRLYGSSGALQRRVVASQLRARDPRTGDLIEDSPFLPESCEKPAIHVHKTNQRISPSIDPNAVERKGRYGFAVKWGDGATIIYSKKSVAAAVNGIFED